MSSWGESQVNFEDPEAFEEPNCDPEGEETMTEMEEYVRGLREMADALEKNDFPGYKVYPLRIDVFALTVEEHEALSKRLGGFREKIMEGSYAIYRRRFGPHYIDLNLNRSKICERVQVGERVVPATEEKVEPVFEWVCEDESWVPAA